VGHAHRERVAIVGAAAQDLGVQRACRCFPPAPGQNVQFGVSEIMLGISLLVWRTC
jgi:hypothetical protein